MAAMDNSCNVENYDEEFDYALDQLPYVQYGIDGFTSTGLTVIAGQAGLGKTSAIVPLAAQAAHLVRVDGNGLDIRPLMRRKVVYVTEDKNQVARILFGIKNHCSDCSEAEFKKWFIVIPSERRKPEELAQDIARWRKKYAYEADVDLNHFMVEPLIIIDTANANIDLDNENDNAEVGRAIAAIKQALGDGMCWVIAHIAKQMTKADAKDLSIRGAGAWGADANATGFLVSDESLPGKRFLILAKRRFEAEFTEIEISSEILTAEVSTPWNKAQIQSYRVSSLLGLAARNCMKNQAGKAKAERFEKDIIDALHLAYQKFPDKGAWRGISVNKLAKEIRGNTADVKAAIAGLAKSGKIESRRENDGITAAMMCWLKGQTLRAT